MSDPYGKFIWMDGAIIPAEEATVSILSHSLNYGWAAFEGLRFYKTPQGRAIFRLGEHVDRFRGTLKAMGMRLPYVKKEYAEAIKETVRRASFEEGYIRPVAFYGEGIPLHPPRTAHLAIGVYELKDYFQKPLNVTFSKYLRLDSRTIESATKISGYYANSLFAVNDALASGFDEALLLDTDGNVAEGPGANFFMVKKRVLYTPSLGSILPGITRASIIEFLRRAGTKVAEQPISPKMAMGADEAFLTGTAMEVTPIKSINGKQLGNGNAKGAGPITFGIKETFAGIVRGSDPAYRKWLTPVGA